MKIGNLLSKSLLIPGLALIGFSCTKPLTYKSMGDAGQTIVKLINDDGDYRLRAIGLVSTPQVVDLLDIRRDIPNGTELGKTMTVVIEDDQTLVDDYNTANGTSYVALPADKYTVDPGNPRAGGLWTVTLAPGEFAKGLKISIPNSLGIDLSQTYAMGFRIKTVDANGKISAEAHQAVVEIGVKNKYDGEYSVNVTTSGWAAYGISDNMPAAYPGNLLLITSGAATLNIENIWGGSDLQPAMTAGNAGGTQFGAASPVFTFDLATDKLINVDNAIPDDGRGRDFMLNPAAPASDNLYDPATKTIYANYIMVQNGRPNQIIRMVMKYVGPR